MTNTQDNQLNERKVLFVLMILKFPVGGELIHNMSTGTGIA